MNNSKNEIKNENISVKENNMKIIKNLDIKEYNADEFNSSFNS
jgi:hypothetical protein